MNTISETVIFEYKEFPEFFSEYLKKIVLK